MTYIFDTMHRQPPPHPSPPPSSSSSSLFCHTEAIQLTTQCVTTQCVSTQFAAAAATVTQEPTQTAHADHLHVGTACLAGVRTIDMQSPIIQRQKSAHCQKHVRRAICSASVSYRYCPHSTRSRVYETIGCPSVCMSHLSAAAACGGFAAVGPMGRR